MSWLSEVAAFVLLVLLISLAVQFTILAVSVTLVALGWIE